MHFSRNFKSQTQSRPPGGRRPYRPNAVGAGALCLNDYRPKQNRDRRSHVGDAPHELWRPED
jgi:hypothetical protein